MRTQGMRIMQTTCGQRNPQPKIRLNSASLRTPQACFFILTILEVVVSICWVAISIDMIEVTAKKLHFFSFPPGAGKKKSPLDGCPNEWEASPEVHGLVEALFLESEPHRPPPPLPRLPHSLCLCQLTNTLPPTANQSHGDMDLP